MTEDIKYGYRHRETGQLMRLETSFGHSDEYGDETNYYLTLEKAHPYLMSDSLGDIFIMKHQSDFICGTEWKYERYPKSMADFDIVRFVTSNDFEGSDVDPVAFSTVVERLDFKFIRDLDLATVSRKRGELIFSNLDTSDLKDVAYFLVKSKDHTADDLKGSILVSSFGRSGDVMPKGVFDARVIGDETYIATTRSIHNPEFNHAVSLRREPPGFVLEAIPFCSTRISFSFEQKGEALLKEIWMDDSCSIWPEGWTLDDIDGYWNAPKAIFEVEELNNKDRFRVRELLDKIQNKLDPRDELAPKKGM